MDSISFTWVHLFLQALAYLRKDGDAARTWLCHLEGLVLLGRPSCHSHRRCPTTRNDLAGTRKHRSLKDTFIVLPYLILASRRANHSISVFNPPHQQASFPQSHNASQPPRPRHSHLLDRDSNPRRSPRLAKSRTSTKESL